MRIPVRVINWKSRALAAEQERDALQRELTMADAVETTLRARLDEGLEALAAAHNRRLAAENARDIAIHEARMSRAATATLQAKVRTWIDTPSSAIRRGSRVALANHLGWPLPRVPMRKHDVATLAANLGELADDSPAVPLAAELTE